MAIVAVSLVWHVLLFARLADCPAWAAQTLSNDVTFSVIHPTSFAVAVGVFALAFDWKIAFGGGRLLNGILLALLIVLVTGVVLLAVHDFGNGTQSPYLVRQACKAFDDENALRKRFSQVQNAAVEK